MQLNEPTSNLNPGSKWSLIELLRQLPKSKTVATHDLELVKALCQRTIILDEGKIVAEGGTEKILTDIPLLKAHDWHQPRSSHFYFRLATTAS